jgi:hypothetical protein
VELLHDTVPRREHAEHPEQSWDSPGMEGGPVQSHS